MKKSTPSWAIPAALLFALAVISVSLLACYGMILLPFQVEQARQAKEAEAIFDETLFAMEEMADGGILEALENGDRVDFGQFDHLDRFERFDDFGHVARGHRGPVEPVSVKRLPGVYYPEDQKEPPPAGPPVAAIVISGIGGVGVFFLTAAFAFAVFRKPPVEDESEEEGDGEEEAEPDLAGEPVGLPLGVGDSGTTIIPTQDSLGETS